MRKLSIGILFGAALGMAACATYYDDGGRSRVGGYDYVGRDYDRPGNGCGFFGGSGGRTLDPWLACTREGQGIIARGFDSDRDGKISRATAERANVAFRRHADVNRDMCLTDAEVRAALANAERFERQD